VRALPIEQKEATRSFGLQYISLFSSVGTLLCCALPSLLVLFGLGATVAGVLSAAPWLVALSQHRTIVFSVAGGLIGSNFVYLHFIGPRLRIEVQACPPDNPSCGTATRYSKAVLWLSAVLYGIGFFTAFVLGPLLLWWDARG